MTKPKWTAVKIKLGQIQAWDNNPRMSTKAQAQRIIASERKFGQPVPFLVAPEVDGRFLLYDGHQRLAAWFTVYGADYEMDAMKSDRPLTEAEHKELIITLHTGATGSWDWNALSGWSAGDLQEWGMNADALKGWNNDANNLKELLTAEVDPVDAEPQTDRAGELAEKWQTASGQLWKLGAHRLLIGDCTVRENVERLMGGERAGACVTDSPYGINREGIENDDPEGLRALFDGCLAVMPIDNGVIINFQSPRLFPAWLDAARSAGQKFERALWMYDENDQTKPWHYWLMCSQIAIISTIGKAEWIDAKAHHDCYVIGLSREWRAGGDDNNFAHASVKPVGVIQDVMAHIGGIYYEPFAGSGTTIIAAHNLNRRCFAMEISEKYGAVILQRFLDATGIQPELTDTP